MESRLTEVMNMKMHSIQFRFFVTVIQMKLMKVIYAMKNMATQQY
jgi:hypothetical protein